MKIVLNECYGGYGVSEKWAKAHGYEYGWEVERTNPELIAAIEAGEAVSGSYSKLAVVEIPDEATDWEIIEYDGLDTIIAVVDGKLVHI